jgi:uncharacterized lipoprotein YajG
MGVVLNNTQGQSLVSTLMRKLTALIAIAITLLVGCSSNPEVRVRNQSAMPIRNIRLSGKGFSVQVPDLAPGEAWMTNVKPSGESGVHLSFNAGARRFDVAEQGYFEAQGGYKVEVLIEPNMTVRVNSRL